MQWHDLVKGKRSSLLACVPPEWRLTEQEVSLTSASNVTELVTAHLDTLELQITEASACEILSNIRSGEYTSKEVVLAFNHRASLAHQYTNCLSEINFEDAIRRAKQLDIYQRQHNRVIGPLHGLPISLLDRFNVEGLESACGFASWLGSPKSAAQECALVQGLRQLGAIPFCKTNIPMSMMMGETANNVIGTTTNPHNRTLSAGGAAGGEGALLGLKGSPLGLATDVAGSSRIPASFNHLFALKTSEGRLPASGIETVLIGLPVAAGGIGLMSAHQSTLLYAFKALLETNPWHNDVNVFELPWRPEKYEMIRRRSCAPDKSNGKLVFALVSTDGDVQTHPPVSRALRLTKQALLNRGYEVIDWKPLGHATAVDNLFKIFGSTSGKSIRDTIDASGEPPVSQLKDWYDQGDVECSTTAEFWNLCRERDDYRAQYAKQWAETSNMTRSGRQIDGIIMPVAPSTAVREGGFKYYAYTAIANVLDYTAAAFPVMFGDSDLDHDETNSPALGPIDESIKQSYSKKDSHGMPVGLQVLCQRHQEERVLGLMEAIVDALKLDGYSR